MSQVIFQFNGNVTEDKDETTDIQLCANRWALYRAISEVDNLLRGIFNGKFYNEVYLTRVKDGDFLNNAQYKIREESDGDIGKSETFIPADFVIARLENAIEDVRFLLD